jgi:transposase-like protein
MSPAKRNKAERIGTSDTLSPRQERVALALASGTAIADICRQFKIGRTTLWNWLRLPTFKARVYELRKQSVDAVLGQMTELLGNAAAAYADLLSSSDMPPRLKLDTANSVYDRFVGLTNFAELKAEIEALKANLRGK